MNDLENVKDHSHETINDAEATNRRFKNQTNSETHQYSKDNNVQTASGKNMALIAHITFIGWIVAFIMNNNVKDPYASFYIRQLLGLGLIGIVLSFIPVIGWFMNLGIIILWIISLIGSLSGEQKLTPILGPYFQDWFKSL